MFGPTLTLKKTLQKVALDQFAFAPFNQIIMISSVGIMQGLNSLELIKQKLKNELPTVMFTGWKIWPAVQLVNFYYVPFLLRPLVISIVSMFWHTFLAWYSNSTP